MGLLKTPEQARLLRPLYVVAREQYQVPDGDEIVRRTERVNDANEKAVASLIASGVDSNGASLLAGRTRYVAQEKGMKEAYE